MNRGAGRRATFRVDLERRAFVCLLSEFDSRFGVEVHGYCLMTNHFHLLLRSRSGRLSEAMAWLGSRFTRSVNDERGVDGAIFRGRFHSVRVEREAHLDWLFRYINANPLDLGWSQPLADYPWSGLAVSLDRRGGRRGDWLRTDHVRERFGGDLAALESFVELARLDASGPSSIAGIREDDARRAVSTARAPGPDVHSEPDCRAATTVISLAAGIPLDVLSTVHDLDARSARRFVRRADRRCSSGGPAAVLVERAMSILAYERDAAA